LDGDPAGRLYPKGGEPPTAPGEPRPTTRDRWTVEVVPKAARILVDSAWEPQVHEVALAADDQRR
ncbi:MAG: hypothetical protein M3Y45_03280, partial [Actinomycetota bacterium]|nr:hypothetical protein [Actinomycetota bacterium]